MTDGALFCVIGYIMKILIKKDIKKLLPAYASAIMAGVGLTLITLMAALSGNGGFTTTALMLFFVAMILVNVYIMYKNATLFRDNLSDIDYLKAITDKGLDSHSFAFNKLVLAIIQTTSLVSEYMLLFIVCFFIANSKISLFGDELAKNDLGFIKDIFAGESLVQGLLSYVDMLFMAMAFTVVCFAAYGLCHTYFIRGRYKSVAGLMTFFTMFWLVWKIYDLFVPTQSPLRTIITVIYCVAVTSGLGMVVTRLVSKKSFKALQIM